jgi:NADH-quinone oxidoreductase subunit E
MFQLQPVGSVAHLQICGTTSCMICGAEDLIAVCKDKIAPKAHQLSPDGKFSWEEVECLGACANAPMAQIGKDYYEDLTAEKLGWIIDEMAAGRVPTPGPQNGRYASEPLGGLTSLTDHEAGRDPLNVSARLATDIGDTIKRIDGTEVPLLAPWGRQSGGDIALAESKARVAEPRPAAGKPVDRTGVTEQAAQAEAKARPASQPAVAAVTEAEPERLSAPRAGQPADDLKKISGVGPKLEALLNEMGFWHFDQIAAWSPEQIAWVDARLKFKGRIERDDWIGQAATLAATQ